MGVCVHTSSSQYVFLNNPRKLEMRDYENVAGEFAETVSKFDLVESIFQAGSVSVPGISDLDFVVVIRDPAVDTRRLVSTINGLFAKHRYVCMHNAFVISEGILRNFNKYVKIEQPRLLFGKDIKVREVEDTYQLMFLIDMLNDLWPAELYRAVTMGQVHPHRMRHFLKEMADIFFPHSITKRFKKPVNVRFNLCKLNNATQMARLLEEVTGASNPYLREYSERIFPLRNNWFNLGSERYEELMELIDGFPRYCIEIMEEISRYLQGHWFEFRNPHRYIANSYRDFRVNLYLEHFRREEVVRLLKDYFVKYKLRIHILPDPLSLNENIRARIPIYPSNLERYEKYCALLSDRDTMIREKNDVVARVGIPAHGHKSRMQRTFLGLLSFLWKLKYAIVLREIRLLLCGRLRKRST